MLTLAIVGSFFYEDRTYSLGLVAHTKDGCEVNFAAAQKRVFSQKYLHDRMQLACGATEKVLDVELHCSCVTDQR